MKPIKINNILIKNPLFLAPMVDVTDLPFRLMCKRQGAGMVYTEMLHVESIIHENKKTKDKMFTIHEEKPIGIQITSRTLAGIKKVIPLIQGYDLVDLNCGCPSHLTLDHGSGANLLKTPEKIYKMVKMLKDAGFTTTAKIRLGFSKNEVLKLSKLVEKAGADAITIHARLAKQGRDVPADWKEIKKARLDIGIPLIGNGDVKDEESAEKMLEIADGAMIARATVGDPGIFNRIIYYLKTGKKKDFSFKENIKLYKEYFSIGEKYKILNFQRAKYIGGKFIQRTLGASQLRNSFSRLKTSEEIKSFIKNLA